MQEDIGSRTAKRKKGRPLVGWAIKLDMGIGQCLEGEGNNDNMRPPARARLDGR